MRMSNIENEMAVKYASIRVREETRDAFMDYLSQLIGSRRNAGLTQDDGVLELLKCGRKVMEEERRSRKN
jgi:hypothetical protein